MKNTNKINKLICYIKTVIIYKPRFNKIGKRTILFYPMQIDNPKSIRLGKKIFISNNAWLMGGINSNEVTLSIGDGCRIGHFFHCIGLEHVSIGNSVLIADKVFISDVTHNFEDITKPILDQGVRMVGKVEIGNNSWIGENVSIIGASIGTHCIIGANSVVNRDIPDYSIAVGSPARIIKKYNMMTGTWNKIENEIGNVRYGRY